MKLAPLPLHKLVLDASNGLASGERTDDGVIQIRMNNVGTDGSLNFTKALRIPIGKEDLLRFSVEPGDVLFNNTNSPELVGKTAYFAGHSERVLFSNHFTRIRTAQDRLLPKYLARYLTRCQQTKVFENLCVQWVNQSAVKRERLLGLTIPIPFPNDPKRSLAEQARITAILDEADGLRRKHLEAAGVAGEMLAGMINKQVVNRHVGRQATLGDACKIQMGQSPPGDTYNPNENGLPFFQGKAEFGDRHPVAVKWCSQPSRIAEPGDILMSVRAPVGPTNVADARCCIGRGLAALRAIEPTMNQPYLQWLLRGLEAHWSAKSTGSTFEAINRNTIENMLVVLPTPAEQTRIANLLDEADNVRRLHLKAADTAAQLLASLSQRAFRGEL